MANVQPNRYELKSTDGSSKVTYETSTLFGQPSLSLSQGSNPARNFTGSQIRTLSTEIGTLVTVTTFMTIDAGSTSFILLIPAIGLPSAAKSVEFTTDAIITSHRGPDSFPMNGVFESYQFIPMQGEASFVIALLETELRTTLSAALARAAGQ